MHCLIARSLFIWTKTSTAVSQSRKEAEREVKGSRVAGQSYSRESERVMEAKRCFDSFCKCDARCTQAHWLNVGLTKASIRHWAVYGKHKPFARMNVGSEHFCIPNVTFLMLQFYASLCSILNFMLWQRRSGLGHHKHGRKLSRRLVKNTSFTNTKMRWSAIKKYPVGSGSQMFRRLLESH